MKWLLRLWGILSTIPNRLLAQLGLVLAETLGLVFSISLILSIPLYADAVYYRTLQANLAPQGENQLRRPPFAFLLQYYGGWHKPVQWEDTRKLDEYVTQSASSALGLPLKQLVRYFSTDASQLFPLGTSDYKANKPLSWVHLTFMSDFFNHVQLVEGNLPVVAGSDGPVEVVISEQAAAETGFQLNETYQVYLTSTSDTGTESHYLIPVKIVGFWQALQPDDVYWISSPSNFNYYFFVPEETFAGRIAGNLPNEVFAAYWYMNMDGSSVRSSQVDPLLGRIAAFEKEADALLPGSALNLSPAEELTNYKRDSGLLTILLFAFAIPIIGLILAFIGLVAGLSVERQRNEIAVLRSRGAAAGQILAFTVIESLFMGLLSLVISLPVASILAQVIGQSRSFLDFSLSTQKLQVGITPATLEIGIAAVILTLVTQSIPTIDAARYTILSYKQTTGRAAKAPWWQRSFMDVLLFIPAAYGTYLLKQQGTLALFGTAAGDPFRNPLLFLVPALAIFSLSLFCLRLIQPVMAAVSWFAELTGNVGLLLASRQLSRSPGSYNTPLIILILTVSLSAYTASLSTTIDHHLHDQVYYQVGSDLILSGVSDSNSPTSGAPPGIGAAASTDTSSTDTTIRWTLLPISEYLRIPGVQAATRFGEYTASATFASNQVDANFIGLDRVDFPLVAFWRKDFASESLGALMNRLALDPEGVLVDRGTMAQTGLQEGDKVSLTVKFFGQDTPLEVRIVGSFDMFPTWYAQKGPLFIGNLDSLFEQAGGEFPYQVLLKTNPNADFRTVDEQQMNQLKIPILTWQSAQGLVADAQQRPERQGLFGFLFIGFAAAAVLTALAFLLYVLFSFQRRFIELGVLRAAGLSVWQMGGYLVWELTFLIVAGGVIGTVLGVIASKVFIPFLQIGMDAASLTPPFDVIIAWSSIFQIYILFGILFALTLFALVILFRRMKIFQAIKMGESV